MTNQPFSISKYIYTSIKALATAIVILANSVYKLLITTVLFPIYYKAVTADHLTFAGFTLKNTVIYDYALAAAFLIIALLILWRTPLNTFQKVE